MEDRELLDQLFSGGDASASAWRAFLQKYSNLFLKIIWQFEKDRDEVMEKYVSVCSRLMGNDFAVLRKFPKELGLKSSDFPSWLVAVVRNISVDLHRHSQGRRRYPKALLRLDPIDRKIFDLYYWQGYSLEEIGHQLDLRKNGKGTDVNESFARILRMLTRYAPRERKATFPTSVPFNENMFVPDEEEPRVDVALFDKWLEGLPAEHRLVVRMRFWEDMSAVRIARILKIVPQHRVYAILQKSLQKLRTHVERNMASN
ncbi:MAG: hypothetical protein HYY49_05610 [Ignavibacteriales bacterium]|nr:hypothetical protein [Ignavibacteriales bacterium]